MAWQGIEGHDDIVDLFRCALNRNRLASTFLLVGPRGIGKRLFAERLAQTLLCSEHDATEMAPCGKCPACQQVRAGTHPDLLTIEVPEGKRILPVELFIGSRERRGREGLCRTMAMKPFMGGRKIGIIDDADCLNEEAANCLLKTLEEPPPQSVLILIGTSADRQLPTIRSRCQILRFRPLPTAVVADLLVRSGRFPDRADAERLARQSEGSLARAAELSANEFGPFRDQFLEQLAAPHFDTVRIARSVAAFVDAAGKETAQKRVRIGLAIEAAMDFYRGILATCVDPDSPLVVTTEDPEFSTAIRNAAGRFQSGDEGAMACLDRCQAALTHIERNANVATLTECWLDDLSRLSVA